MIFMRLRLACAFDTCLIIIIQDVNLERIKQGVVRCLGKRSGRSCR